MKLTVLTQARTAISSKTLVNPAENRRRCRTAPPYRLFQSFAGRDRDPEDEMIQTLDRRRKTHSATAVQQSGATVLQAESRGQTPHKVCPCAEFQALTQRLETPSARRSERRRPLVVARATTFSSRHRATRR